MVAAAVAGAGSAAGFARARARESRLRRAATDHACTRQVLQRAFYRRWDPAPELVRFFPKLRGHHGSAAEGRESFFRHGEFQTGADVLKKKKKFKTLLKWV